MSHAQLQLDLLPESERISPADIYIRESLRGDPEEFGQGLVAWVDFLRDAALFASDELSPAAFAVYQADAYTDGHALHFHNLKRGNRLEATLLLIRAGLAQLPPAFGETLALAETLYAANRALWDVPSFTGKHREAHARAREIMAPADRRFNASGERGSMTGLLVEAILALPTLHLVSDADYARIREAALRSSPRRQAQLDARAAAIAAAEAERQKAILNDPIAFAAAHLAVTAGYAGLATIDPGYAEFPGRDAESWMVGLRTQSGGAQINTFLRVEGKYALMDLDMNEVRAAASIAEVEAIRNARLRAENPEPPAPPRRPSALRGWGSFGRKR